jgi:hypothetical protein
MLRPAEASIKSDPDEVALAIPLATCWFLAVEHERIESMERLHKTLSGRIPIILVCMHPFALALAQDLQ